MPANGVVWHGGHSREGAMRIAATADIGLGWRHPSLDASLELSTKVLEFGLLGLPVILNRTPMHEDLLGADYPMFARDLDDVVAIAESAAADPAMVKLAASRTSAAAAGYTLDKASRAGPPLPGRRLPAHRRPAPAPRRSRSRWPGTT